MYQTTITITFFVRKVFATKILLSGKFSFFLTLDISLFHFCLQSQNGKKLLQLCTTKHSTSLTASGSRNLKIDNHRVNNQLSILWLSIYWFPSGSTKAHVCHSFCSPLSFFEISMSQRGAVQLWPCP